MAFVICIIFTGCFVGAMVAMNPTCETVSGPSSGVPCVFPFTYRGTAYGACTELDHSGYWCATETDKDGSYLTNKWGNCDCQGGCCSKKACETVSGPSSGVSCVFPFTYKGRAYGACTELDHSGYWCATETDNDGTFLTEKWGNCDCQNCGCAKKGCKCGRAKQNRILGGKEAKVNAYPWMAALANQQESFYCGGTLVAAEWVVTASHCLSEDRAQTITTPPGKLKIVLGEHDKKSANSVLPRRVVSVKKIIKHPSYNPKTFDNDIALIKLAEVVDMNVYRPACVASIDQEDLTGKKAWVYGWGTTAENGRTSDTLMEVDVPIVSSPVCQAAYNDLGLKIHSGMLCAGGISGQDSCQGDSGGPLTVSEGGQHTLVGSVSFGYGCGRANRYGVYARTAAYRQWIDSTIASNGGAPVCSS